MHVCVLRWPGAGGAPVFVRLSSVAERCPVHACCERHTGSQHIISLSCEPLLTLLAFSAPPPPSPTKRFFMMPFKPGLCAFGKWALVSAKEALLFSGLKDNHTGDFFFHTFFFTSLLKNRLNYVIANINTNIAFEVCKVCQLQSGPPSPLTSKLPCVSSYSSA